MPEHHTKTETAYERTTETWFFTEAEIIEMCEAKLGRKMPEGTRPTFYSSYSPAYMRWQENPSKSAGPSLTHGYTLSFTQQTK
jgi:hypothetical protein